MTSKGSSTDMAARLLQGALAHHQKGQLAQARALYTQVLGFDRSNFDALQLLGLCCLQGGDLQPARQYLDRALAIRRDVASVFNHRGVVLRRLGEADAAIADFSRVIALNPRAADAHYNRANALRELGRLREALEDYRRAAALEPRRPEFLNNLGGCLKELQLDEEALACYDRLLALDPAFADAHANRGLVLLRLGRFEGSLASQDRALALSPASAEAWSNRGGALIALKRLDEAVASLGKALALAPGHAGALIHRGVAFTELGRTAEAAASFEQALAAEPRSVEARIGLGKLASEEGRFAVAEALFEAVRQDDPGNVECLYGLAELRKYKAGDPLFAAFESHLGDSTLSRDRQVMLNHGYAKICNDAGRHDDAMLYFARSKALSPASFDLALHRATYAAIRETFSPDFFAQRTGLGVSDARPVFVIGMPRSGTTLTEQILAAHARVAGLGELNDMPRVSRELGGGLGNVQGFLAACAGLDQAQAARLADSYREAYRGRDPALLRLVDKRPHNYELLGLIALLFPKAHIIHCSRSPIDTCLSMYMQDFAEGHGYNRDLAMLGHYFTAYEDLMAHWRAVLPLPIHDCVYEDTVADLETSARALIAFLGLAWDPNCLAFHSQERQVRTPSQWQVRQPVYRSSVERWRPYEAHLGPLKEALGLE